MPDLPPTATRSLPGKIVTFYSYKGGVGRSMALANIAVILAKLGKSVLIVDWDLEAPGLDRYFEAQKVEGARVQGGLMGVLKRLRDLPAGRNSPAQSGPDAEGEVAAADTANSEELPEAGQSGFLQDYYLKVTLETGHALDILASGDSEDSYAGDVAAFSWADFFAHQRGAERIEGLRAHWRETYDFTLIDSRTGITDAGGVCTVQLPDHLVLVFAANAQNLEGAMRVVQGIHRQRGEFGFDRERLLIVPLLSRFDGRAESDLSKHWLDLAAETMQPMLDDWLPKHTPALEYFDKTKLPHIPKFAFGEQLACLHERETDPDSLTYYYGAIARLLAGHLHRPERLLSLRTRLSEQEKAEILRRAKDHSQARETIRQMESLIASLPAAARVQAEQLRENIQKITPEDADLRQDLEFLALEAVTPEEHEAIFSHLNDLPGWTEKDTAALLQEGNRRQPQADYDLNQRIKNIIEQVGTLTKRGGFSAAENLVQSLPDRPAEVVQIKKRLLEQVTRSEAPYRGAEARAAQLMESLQTRGHTAEQLYELAHRHGIDQSDKPGFYAFLKTVKTDWRREEVTIPEVSKETGDGMAKYDPYLSPARGVTRRKGVLWSWRKKDGDQVSKGDPLFVLETDQALTEVLAANAGFLRIRVEAGVEVMTGETVATIDYPVSGTQRGTPPADPARRRTGGRFEV